MEIRDRVKKQYELFPYPNVSLLSWLGKIKPATPLPLDSKKIALLGCGTTEAVAFGSYKNAEIHACDISEKSIYLSQLRSRMAGMRNIKFYNQDLVQFSKHFSQEFDYVHAYGVLHHLENPEEGFKAIKRILKPDGHARVMVYSKANRKKITHLQKVFKLMGLDFQNPGFEKELRAFIKTIPLENPLRLAFEMHSEVKNTSGLVDAFLHANEKCFSIQELTETLKRTGLKISTWDFSQNIQNILSDVHHFATVEEKIALLEATDQWPGNFTFWVQPC